MTHSPGATDTALFEARESNVRSYCRAFPTVFNRAKGSELFDEQGRRFIDFFCGAGTLNYGHNPEQIKHKLIAYLQSDGLIHALDTYTPAKRDFLSAFTEHLLWPRGLDYKVQFCGPTGTNAVEAALKLARKVTGRTGVFAFSGSYHGMTLGSSAVTSGRSVRAAAGVPLAHTTFIPFPVGPQGPFDSLAFMNRLLADSHSGVDVPAAVILEALQVDGGIYAAPEAFLRGLRALCDSHGILLIVDDIQAGCGRTGRFFSFERAGIVPDLVTVSKGIGGYGLPMSLLLIRPDVDAWQPGEHTGTFRGNQLAFVAATAALDFWRGSAFPAAIEDRSHQARGLLERLVTPGVELRGVGLAWGVDLAQAGGPERAARVQRRCFERGLVIERCGREDTVLKVMPPLIIEPTLLEEGIGILASALADAA